ncbi:hypothetical protein [Nocardia nova]|uniref:hypothetical protein n=1 Tax=Nocardia nova TaxID=37330 RepID=UPI0034054D0B
MKPTLPQRRPCETTTPVWSPAIALLDDLLAALQAWQPGDLSPSPPTEQDLATLSEQLESAGSTGSCHAGEDHGLLNED